MLKTSSGDLALGPWGFVPGRERGGSCSCCTLVPGPEMGAAGGRAEATLCMKLHPSHAAHGLWLRCLAIAHAPPPCPKPPIVSPCHGLPQSPSGRLQWGVQLCMDQGCASHGNCGAVMCHWAHDVIGARWKAARAPAPSPTRSPLDKTLEAIFPPRVQAATAVLVP